MNIIKRSTIYYYCTFYERLRSIYKRLTRIYNFHLKIEFILSFISIGVFEIYKLFA